MILPLRILTLADKSVNLDESVIKSAEIIRHTENFSNSVIVDCHGERFCFGVSDMPNLRKTFAVSLAINQLSFVGFALNNCYMATGLSVEEMKIINHINEQYTPYNGDECF